MLDMSHPWLEGKLSEYNQRKKVSKSWLLSFSKSRVSGVKQRRSGGIRILLFFSCPRFFRLERKDRRECRERSRVRRKGTSSFMEESSISGQHQKAVCQGVTAQLIDCPSGTMGTTQQPRTLINSWPHLLKYLLLADNLRILIFFLYLLIFYDLIY